MTGASLSKDRAIELLQNSIDKIPGLENAHTGAPEFAKWRRMTAVTIERIFSPDSQQLKVFSGISYSPPPVLFASIDINGNISPPPEDPRPYYKYGLERSKAMLESIIEEIETFGIANAVEGEIDALATLELVCSRFHTVARQLRQRHSGRPTLDVNDEYDVQDLLHSLLRIYFDDIREEESTPSYAGGASRIDFLLKPEQIIIEVKKARPTLKAKELGEELIIDIARYQTHPDCKMLYCFVYDPDGYIKNPQGIENDLSRSGPPFPVKVFIAPKTH
jgi:hypothetical protein